MINYKCLRKVGPCLFVAESIGKDGETYYLNVNVKRRAYSRIKRTSKRQIAKAKHMMAWHDRKEGGVKIVEEGLIGYGFN